MLEAYELTHLHDGDEYLEVVVDFAARQKSRLRTQTTDGRELAWFIERGYVLREGDVLKCQDGTLVKVCCAIEQVSDVKHEQALLLMRAAYHLGNRHVPLQVEQGFVRYLRDHVLDEMVIGLGLSVTHDEAPFNPENGAYGGGHHHHH